MKKLWVILMILTIAWAEKPMFEFGGQFFLDTTAYDDGYTKNNRQPLTDYNYRSEFLRTSLFGFVNFAEDSRIRWVVDTAPFHRASNGFALDTWAFFSFLYYEKLHFLGIDSTKVGLFATPWTGWEDKIWNYRMLSRTVLSDLGIAQPQDRGFGFESKLTDKLEYAIAYMGGQGIYTEDYDTILNTEARLTYTLTDTLKASIGGSSGARAIKYGSNSIYSYTYGYNAANLHYKAAPYIASWTVFGTKRIDDDYTHRGTTKQTAGTTYGKGSSVTGIWNAYETYDLIGRVDRYDSNIEIANDLQTKTICGIGYRAWQDNFKVTLTKQSLVQESAALATHTTHLNLELKF